MRPPWNVLPFLAWMALIWSLSSIEQESGRGLLGRVPFFANLAHAPEFGLLSLWLLLLLPRRGGWVELDLRRSLWVWGATIGYAIVDEIHQRSVPGRDSTAFDVVTDGVGAACVLWIVRYVGSAAATERGLWKRLATGVAACAASAAISANHLRLFGV